MSLNGDLSIIGKEAVHCGERHIKHVPLEYPKQIGCSCELGIKCEDAGKHPLKLNGSIYGAKSAIIDPEKSFKIWEQRPRANLGILTGPENDLFVLDVDIDPKKGIDGFAKLEKFEREHGKLPETRRVLTGKDAGRRAMQFQFRYPKGYEHAKWKKSIAPGLEIRAHSNYYVVAPPSMHRAGVRYEYENPESARIYAPQWLIDLAEQRQTGINLVSETALKGERHHNIVAIAGMNRHKDIPLDTALNQCLDYNKNHCSPSKAEYLVRNAVTDVYRRYEPGRAPKSVREEFFLTTSDLTRGERLLLKVAKKSTDNGKKVFKFLYDETGLSDDCPRKYTPRDVLNLLVEKLAYWCNGDTVRMTHLLRNSKRMNEFPEEDTGGLEAWVSLQAEAVVDGFKDADVIEYLDEGGRGLVVSTDLVSKDICSHNYFLTFEDDRQRSDRFEMYNYDGKIYVKTGRSVIEQEVETLTKHRATTTIAREVVEKISRLTRHDREEIDANTPLELIPLRDKIYNIKTDEFTDYSPDLPFFMRYAGMYKPELLDAKSEAIGVLEISYKSKT